MRELLFFILGMFAGGMFGVFLMCLLQVSRLSDREEERLYEETKDSDSISTE